MAASYSITVCSNVYVTELHEIMDDLMQDLAVLYPKKYNLILKAIARLKNSAHDSAHEI